MAPPKKSDNETPETPPTLAPTAKRGRKPGDANKPKSFGQVIGGMLDAFEGFDVATRTKVLAILNRQYGGEQG